MADAPSHFLADLRRVDAIAARPGALIVLDCGQKVFDPDVVTEAEMSFVSHLYTYGYANGWMN